MQPDLSELIRVHAALKLATPFEQLSPLMLQTITVIARCWGGKVPANLFPVPPAKAPRVVFKPNFADAKMRAAHDVESDYE